MPKFLACLLILASPFTVLAAPQAPKEQTSVAAILEASTRFNGLMVRTTGVVKDLELHKSRRGNKYSTFTIHDGKQFLDVFCFGHVTAKDGDKVEVVGRFAKKKNSPVGVRENEIDASPAKGGSVSLIMAPAKK